MLDRYFLLARLQAAAQRQKAAEKNDMDVSTTTCSLTNAEDAAGSFPATSSPFEFASSTCTTLISPQDATGSPAIEYTLTAGDILLGFFLLVLILMQFLGFILRTNA